MDLCYISPPGKPRKPPSELVELLGRMIEVEAPVFAVKMLSRARIPIIKLSPSPIYHLRKQEAELNAQQQLSKQQDQSHQQSSSLLLQQNGTVERNETSNSIRKVSSASAPASAGPTRPSSSSNDKTTTATVTTTTESNASKRNDVETSTSTIPLSSTSNQASSTPPSSSNPLPSPPPMPEYGLSCDIGFENRLALENTRLILTYAMADPRLRTIVLFRKLPFHNSIITGN